MMKRFFYVLTVPVALLFVVAAGNATVETAPANVPAAVAAPPQGSGAGAAHAGLALRPGPGTDPASALAGPRAMTSLGARGTHPAASPAQAPAQARGAQPTGGQAGATYVGSDTCISCHDNALKATERGALGGLEQTRHWKASHPRAPAAAQGCESCHGPGSRHIEDPANDTFIRKFTKMAPREANDACLACHTKSPHTMWQGSTHEARNLSCVTCHSVHEPKSERAQLKNVSQTELCATCHRVQAAKTKRFSHMPVQEAKLECSSCHNPHGSTNVRLLKVGNWVNESCVSCHTEKRGPFLFEHAAGRESCISCHDPHGTSNDRMLVAKLPMLCQRCHIGTRHPSTIYDNLAVQNKSNRIIGRGCVNCHSQIHGSNHPSGVTLTR